MANGLDPIKYEIFYSKLNHALNDAKETVRYLSSSTIVREAGESQSAFYLPTGEGVDIVAGILMHFLNVTRAIRYMNQQEYFKEGIGVYDGDMFINNDTYIGGMHLPDISQIVPIFHNQELLGYVATISHTSETGGIEPGGTCPSAKDAWHDGLHLPALKLVEKGVMRRDVLNLILRAVRTPTQMEIDIKARLAGARRARDRIQEIVAEFGVEFFKKASRQIVEDGLLHARDKIRKLRPGIYTGRVFVDTMGNVIPPVKLAVIQVDLEITGEQMVVRGAVVSPEQPCYNNSQLAGAEGTLYYTLFTQMLYDGRWNSGPEAVISLVLPKGSRLNATEKRSVGYASVGINFAFCAALTAALNRAYYASGLKDEVQAPASGSIDHAILSGTSQFGRPFAMPLMTVNMSLSGGGRLSSDGLSNYHFYNPWQYLADVEGEETLVPAVHLLVGRLPDSGGVGKYRGGPTNVNIGVVWGSDDVQIQFKGQQSKLALSQGLFGGYPSGAKQVKIKQNTNLLEFMAQGQDLPLAPGQILDFLGKIRGELSSWEGSVPAIPAKPGDLWIMSESGGSGLGDPIERDPELVRVDVADGITSWGVAENVYCVVLDPKTLEVDLEATKRLRERRRAERLKKGVAALEFVRSNVEKRHKRVLPRVVLEFLDETILFSSAFKEQILAEERWAGENHKALGRVEVKRTLFEFTPYVNIVESEQGRKVAVCSICSFAYCDAEEDYKLYCLVYERHPKEVYSGEWFTNDSEWAVYREFYCPRCGTQVEVDQCPVGMPIIPDARVKIKTD